MSKKFDVEQADKFTAGQSQLQQQTELSKLKLNINKKSGNANMITLADLRPKEKKTKTVSIKITPSLYEKVQLRAKEQGFTSFSSVMTSLLEAYADEQ